MAEKFVVKDLLLFILIFGCLKICVKGAESDVLAILLLIVLFYCRYSHTVPWTSGTCLSSWRST